MADNDDTSKLIIFGIAIGIIGLFTYMMFRTFERPIPSYERQRSYGFMTEQYKLDKLSQLQKLRSQREQNIELIQKELSNLNTKFDSFLNTINKDNKSLITSPTTPERKTVSMNSLSNVSNNEFDVYSLSRDMDTIERRHMFGMNGQ